MKALIITGDRFEDRELVEPLRRLREEGICAEIAATRTGRIEGKHGYGVEVDKTVDAVDAGDYELLMLPGGEAPQRLRRDPAVLGLVRDFVRAGKPVAAICHGPQILAAAGALKGRHVTCYRSVAGELRAAGAEVEDREVVVDGAMITSRQPSDLPAFMREVIRALKRRSSAPGRRVCSATLGAAAAGAGAPRRASTVR